MMTLESPPHAKHEWVVDVVSRRVMRRDCPACDAARREDALKAGAR